RSNGREMGAPYNPPKPSGPALTGAGLPRLFPIPTRRSARRGPPAPTRGGRPRVRVPEEAPMDLIACGIVFPWLVVALGKRCNPVGHWAIATCQGGPDEHSKENKHLRYDAPRWGASTRQLYDETTEDRVGNATR